jgi:hypothetical protein
MDFVDDSKSCQLRVRVTPEERDLLEKLRTERAHGETISDLVREAISLLIKGAPEDETNRIGSRSRRQVEQLASLLKREPRQVEEACVEGIIDLIESKCTVPLIVMETHLHLKYRNWDDKQEYPWASESQPTPASVNPEPTKLD